MSEINKPEITKKQAEAIEQVRRWGHGDSWILINHADVLSGRVSTWGCSVCALDKMDMLTLAAALINGYEVEKTPEEKVREYFKELSKDIQHYLEFGERKLAETKMEERATALKILDLLGMKVVGGDM